MRKLIWDDIIGIINENRMAGNITSADAGRLCELIRKLYNHLYAHYKEMDEGGLNDMMDDDFVLKTDIIEAEVTKRVTENVTKEVTKEVTKDFVLKLYSKFKDKKRVAELLDLPLDVVQKVL